MVAGGALRRREPGLLRPAGFGQLAPGMAPTGRPPYPRGTGPRADGGCGARPSRCGRCPAGEPFPLGDVELRTGGPFDRVDPGGCGAAPRLAIGATGSILDAHMWVDLVGEMFDLA